MTVGKTQEDPNELFKYLIVNGIGSLCALFYEEYAGYKECAKRFGLVQL
jgi:Mad3/BUB1 homology region 1